MKGDIEQTYKRVCFVNATDGKPYPEVSARMILLYRSNLGKIPQKEGTYGPSIYGETYVSALVPRPLLDMLPPGERPITKPNGQTTNIGGVQLDEVFLRVKKGLTFGGHASILQVLDKRRDAIVTGVLSATMSNSVNLTLNFASLDGTQEPMATQDQFISISKGQATKNEQQLRELGLL